MKQFFFRFLTVISNSLLYGTIFALITGGMLYAAGSSLIGGRITFDVGTNAPEVCIAGVCKTSWPSGGGGKQLVSSAPTSYANSATVTMPGLWNGCYIPTVRYSIDAAANVYTYVDGGAAQYMCTISNTTGWCIVGNVIIGNSSVYQSKVTVTVNGLLAPSPTAIVGMGCSYAYNIALYPWIY